MQKYETRATTSCAKALTIVQHNKVDLVIIDANLGGDDGFELCENILSIFPTMKIIIYSGDTRTVMKDKAIAAGASAFVGKPVDLEEVTEIIKKLIG